MAALIGDGEPKSHFDFIEAQKLSNWLQIVEFWSQCAVLRLISDSLLHRSRSDWEEDAGALLVGETDMHHLLWPTEAQLKSNRNFKILLNYDESIITFCGVDEASIVQKMTFQMASQTCSWRWLVVTVVVWQSFVFHSPLSMNRSLFMWLRIERRLQNVSNSNLPWLLAQWLRRSSLLPFWCIIFFGEDQWHLKRPAPGISRLDLIISESKSPGASREDQLYLTFPETSYMSLLLVSHSDLIWWSF